MDELKLIIEMVANLPSMALWVLVGFWAYKVVVIGSIYGVIRLAIVKLHSWLTTPKHVLTVKEVRPMLDGVVIPGHLDQLIVQIHRIRGRGVSSGSEYIHGCSVQWLREAIDDKIANDDAKKAAVKAAT